MGWMWTKEHRARQVAFERRRYPTDLTDQEWRVIRPLLPPSSVRGRRPGVDLRDVLTAIRYLVWAGCGWRMLPVHFEPWQTILLVVPAARTAVPVRHSVQHRADARS
jgi:transposase